MNLHNFKIEWSKAAEKQLYKLDHQEQGKILEKVSFIAIRNKELDIKKLQGLSSSYRLRVGDYRIIYEIRPEQKLIHINLVAHRKEVYKFINIIALLLFS